MLVKIDISFQNKFSKYINIGNIIVFKIQL